MYNRFQPVSNLIVSDKCQTHYDVDKTGEAKMVVFGLPF